ncbi:MAG TPA: NAD-dependent deacylase [Actinomycetales bacterium]|nr:NAD-dependent deacylase [Actinomycetales bacterium]
MRIVVLTGAGISAESGVATFRDADGLWEGHDVTQVATPEGFAADPDLVQRFYDERRSSLATVEPNAAHRALAHLESADGIELTVVTQNVDDLHERAGSRNVIHMHGQLRSAWCLACDERFAWDVPLATNPACPGCAVPNLRPDIVWFGEIPYEMERIQQELLRADVFASIGTSSEVYPAAGFVAIAADAGARTVELNLRRSRMSAVFDDVRQGPATKVVSEWVAELTA